MAIVMGIGFQFKVWGRYLREYLIKDKNYLDAVINLPGNLFPDTISPTCILVLKKSRMKNQSVLLIDASHGFVQVNGKNRLRKMDINKIVRTYKNREELKYYSHNASFEELKDNDLNLNISRYVEDYYEYMWGKLIDNYSFIN